MDTIFNVMIQREMYLHLERTLIHLSNMKGLLEWGSGSSPQESGPAGTAYTLHVDSQSPGNFTK